MPSKKELSERDICTKLITPTLVKAGWNIETQIRGCDINQNKTTVKNLMATELKKAFEN